MFVHEQIGVADVVVKEPIFMNSFKCLEYICCTKLHVTFI